LHQQGERIVGDLTTDADVGTAEQPAAGPWSDALDVGQTAGREQLDRVLASLTDVVVLLDGDGVIAYVSPGVRRLLGHDHQSLVGRPFGDLERDDGAGLMAELADAVGEGDRRIALTLRHADGSRRDVEASAVPALRVGGGD
jgi:PAS domain S-box-containing protein